MQRKIVYIVGLVILIVSACRDNDQDFKVQIPDFNFSQTVTFETSLLAYDIFEGTISDLKPIDSFEILKLSSSLFTDYAHKQRLVKVPAGKKLKRLNDGSIDFPNGTILTKTFFYYFDDRDTSLGKRIIETRLLIKEKETWNVATYLWNESQTDATLELNGFDTEVSWINPNGENQSTVYHVPTKNECMTCHQSNSSMTPLGPTLLNLNRDVSRNGIDVNQIGHLQSSGILTEFSIDLVAQMVDYNDVNASLEERGRAYLAMNCAHCHNPNAWDIPAGRDFDFRHQTAFENTGISDGKDKILRNVINQEMPFIGTTILDKEGVDLLTKYIESL